MFEVGELAAAEDVAGFADVVAEPEANVAIWRDHLLAAVGPNGRLLTDVVPEFSWLLGETPEPIEL